MLSTMQLEEYLFIPLIYVRTQKESTYAREVFMLDNCMTIMIMIIISMLIMIMFIAKVAFLILNQKMMMII